MPQSGAGVLITYDAEGSVRVTVSNCFIVDNAIGIAIVSAGHAYWHSPIIVNNTIAWNQIGLWNGCLNVAGGFLGPAGNGFSAPRCINNIFDSGTSPGQIGDYNPVVGLSCFEGLRGSFLQARVDNAGLFVNSNAYDDGVGALAARFNIGAQVGQWMATNWQPQVTNPPWPLNWPATQTAPVNPAVNIHPFTNAGGGPRGTLYINDVFWNTQAAVTPTPPLSENDFRLAPWVALDDDEPTVANPLIDVGLTPAFPWVDIEFPQFGITAGTPTATYTMTTPPSLTSPPGLPLLFDANGDVLPNPEIAEVAQYHAWDFDCEGYGNPRAAFDLATIGQGVPNPIPMDIGADEMGDLIMAGYASGTRIYARVSTTTANGPASDQTRIYFFSRQPAATFDTPLVNYRFGGSWYVPPTSAHEWYEQVLNTPFSGVGNYSDGAVSTVYGSPYIPYRNYNFATAPNDCPAWQRGLACDISPHLPIDWHPFWQDFFDFARGTVAATVNNIAPAGDFHGGNPWSDNANGPPLGVAASLSYFQLRTDDNHLLYYNPDPAVWVDEQFEPFRLVTSGHINPPRVLQQDPVGTTRWLWQSEDFGWGLTTSGPLPTVTSNNWCFGQCSIWPVAQYVPTFDWYGIRVNAENDLAELPRAFSNVQSVLFVNGDDEEQVLDFGIGEALERSGVPRTDPQWQRLRDSAVLEEARHRDEGVFVRALASQPSRPTRVAWRGGRR